MISRLNAAAIEQVRQKDPNLFLALQQLINGTNSITSRLQTGTVTLVAGAGIVRTTFIQTAPTARSLVLAGVRNSGGTVGFLSVPDSKRFNGQSFEIDSSSSTDTSTVDWLLVNP